METIHCHKRHQQLSSPHSSPHFAIFYLKHTHLAPSLLPLMPSILPRSLAAALFVPEEGDYYQCRLCFLRRKQTRGTGYTNLMKHPVRCQPATYEDEFRSIQRREVSLDSFVKADEFSRTVYSWLDWIIMENRELSMCEKPKTRKYTHLNPLSVNTLKKHMFGLEDVVQGYVKQRLAGQKIGFAIDAWTEDGNHFIAIIVITSTDKYLLSISTLTDESDMRSDAIIELFAMFSTHMGSKPLPSFASACVTMNRSTSPSQRKPAFQ